MHVDRTRDRRRNPLCLREPEAERAGELDPEGPSAPCDVTCSGAAVVLDRLAHEREPIARPEFLVATGLCCRLKGSILPDRWSGPATFRSVCQRRSSVLG